MCACIPRCVCAYIHIIVCIYNYAYVQASMSVCMRSCVYMHVCIIINDFYVRLYLDSSSEKDRNPLTDSTNNIFLFTSFEESLLPSFLVYV